MSAGNIQICEQKKASSSLSLTCLLLACLMMENEAGCYSMVCSFFLRLHSQVAVGVIPHLCIVKRNKPTPVQRRLSLTQDGLGVHSQWFGVEVGDEST